MGKTVAIHQPNFFPWLGYFDKFIRSDVFVFLDDVQFPKKGGSWSNRVKMLIGGEAKWVTASIERNYSGLRNINEMNFQADNWRVKMLKSLRTNYNKNSFYDETMEVVEPLILNPEKNIAKYNIYAVVEIAQRLSVNAGKIRKSSEFSLNLSSNELLCSITKQVGLDTYMCGGGADGYQDEQVFINSGIQLEFQSFEHPEYPQRGSESFVPGLSVIDAAMNLGWEKVSSILNIPN
jgi:hypothetical protein